jgi:hypothetical protein
MIKYFIRSVLLGYIFAICINNSFSAETDKNIPAGSSELLLQMSYENVLKKDVMAWSSNNEVFLPLLEILSQLKIYHSYDYDKKTLKGYINTPDSSFSFDFLQCAGLFLNKSTTVKRNQFFFSEVDIYVNKDCLNSILDLNCEINILLLTLNIKSKSILPVKVEISRLNSYNNIIRPQDFNKFSPLRFERLRSLFNGGMFSYTFNAK